VKICVKNQQMQQLIFIQFIMYGSSYMFRHYVAILKWFIYFFAHQNMVVCVKFVIDLFYYYEKKQNI
jgi:hypothetical protein